MRVFAFAVLLAATLATPFASAHATDGRAPVGRIDTSTRPVSSILCARLLCPDLIVSEPSELHFDSTTLPGRVLLRATSSINNRGAGPLELRAHRVHGQRWRVYQALYTGAGARRLVRSDAQLVFKHVPGERYGMGDVGAASYWKVQHVAQFELWSLDSHFKALHLVRRGPKVDYCLRDLLRSHPNDRSPPAPVYAACRNDPSSTSDVLGTSPGWADVYPYEYPEQWIDVTGLHGRFAYVQIADPGGRLVEANYDNNVSETFIALPSGRVLGHRGGVGVP